MDATEPFGIRSPSRAYGRDGTFRDQIAEQGLWYMMSVPCNIDVYLTEPQRGVLRQLAGQRGLACRNERVLNGVSPVNVSHLDRQMECETIEVRDYDRGVLRNVFAFCEVWTLCEEDRRAGNGQTCQGLRAVTERLVSRQETSSKFSCSVTNAPLSLGTRQRARWKSDRHFVERTIQDAKMEVGWDDLSSPKYRAYMHTLVIDALTICFVTRTKLKMRNPHPP